MKTSADWLDGGQLLTLNIRPKKIRPNYPAGYRIFYQFEYLTCNIYYKDFSHPCISAEEGDTIF
jgi:hypothetical protein